LAHDGHLFIEKGVRLDADRLHRPTPRLIEGVAALCAALEPHQR